MTHALLPDFVVKRRRYAVEEIGRALEQAAEGRSAWRSSVQLDLPFSTVRDWFRRAKGRAAEQLVALARLALKIGARVGELPTRPLAAMVALLEAVWARSRGREPGLAGRWRFWNAVCSGMGLASNTEPGWA